MEKGYNLFLSNALKHGWSVPKGGIIMWAGLLANVPTGWALCDGANGTPDLRDKFILSVAAAEQPGAKGGAHNKALAATNIPSHRHSVNHDHGAVNSGYQSASHSHYFDRTFTSSNGGNVCWQKGASDAPNYRQTTSGQSASHYHSVNLPNYVGNSGYYGSGSSFDNRPAYFKLAYIMKT